MADYDVELVDITYEVANDAITVDLVQVDEGMPYEVLVSSPAAQPEQTVVNRVWDTVAADFVRWQTETVDSGGTSYPGPGVFGVNTSDYVVETIQFTRV